MGYEISRFVGLSEESVEDLKCGICSKILCRPVVTQCCHQTYCNDCINSWIKSNNNCHYNQCNQSIKSEDLLMAPKMVINILDKLRIRCHFDTNGCKEVLRLNELSEHMSKNCNYNPERVCIYCNLKIGTDYSKHNCVKCLIKSNESFFQLNQTFIKSNAKQNREIIRNSARIKKLEKENQILREENRRLRDNSRRNSQSLESSRFVKKT